METRNAELRNSLRDGERRRREEAQLVALQQQVDELRHALREQTTRQQRLEEQIRQSEAQVGQARLELDEARQEASRIFQLRQLEDQRLRDQVSDLQGRVDEPVRPLRNLQAHLTDVAEQVRLQREYAAQRERRIDDVQAQVEGFRGEVIRALDGTRQVREGIEVIQQAQAVQARETEKIGDQIRLVEQEMRRRFSEIDQQLTKLGAWIREVETHRPVLEEMIRQVRDEVRLLPPQIDELANKDKQTAEHVDRVNAQAEERDSLMRERLEDMREYLANQLHSVESALAEAAASLHERIGEWEAAQRDLSGRLGTLGIQITALSQADDRQVESLRRSEERLVRLNLEQAQEAWEALMERRRKESEG
jgi:chromosome segregation ATPase